MLLLEGRQIKKSYGIKEVLKGVSFSIGIRERVGLIGSNGAGKSTLAGIIAGRLKADEGTLNFFGKSPSITVYDQERAEEEFLCSGKETLSGGEKAKASLVKALAQGSSLLILDEPTNNLDQAGISWLIRELKGYPGAVLIISHDRYFLDETVSRILYLADGRLKSYPGNYSRFREEKKKQDEAQYHQYLEEQKVQKAIREEIQRLREWSAKAHRESMIKQRTTGGKKEYFRKKAKKMDRQIKSKLKMLEKRQQNELVKPQAEQEIKMGFAESGGHGRRILEVTDLSKSYGSKTLFAGASFYVLWGEKVGIYGANGSGKTTLLKCLLGKEMPDEGQIWLSPSAKWMYFHQDLLELPLEQTPLQYLAGAGKERDEAVRVMAGLGLYGECIGQPINRLSLGQKTRLKLARVILEECDLLLLDEPTNHLDIVSREQLEEALAQYKGTMLLVTHDRYLLENVCNRMLVIEDRTLRRLETASLSSGKEGREKSKEQEEEREQEQMLLELRLTYLLSRLAALDSTDPAYPALDQEFKELTRRKKELARGI